MSKKPTTSELVPCYDFNRRTCLRVSSNADTTKYIPLDIAEGLVVLEMQSKEFDRRYQPMVDYPAEKAAQLYLGYGLTIGASEEALDFLRRTINITQQEYDMATSKKKAAEKAAEGKKATAAKKATKTTSKPAAKEPGAKRETASQMFKDLIMEGKLTDDQIFTKVKAKFGLDDSKRGYVKWYRNNLRKTGTKNVPDPKE